MTDMTMIEAVGHDGRLVFINIRAVAYVEWDRDFWPFRERGGEQRGAFIVSFIGNSCVYVDRNPLAPEDTRERRRAALSEHPNKD